MSKRVSRITIPSDHERWRHSIASALVELKRAPSGYPDRKNAKRDDPIEDELADGTSPASCVSAEP
jgi:hypothetical protein